jgi:arsenate reductase
MAEALLNHLCGETFAAESAGLKAGTINPLVVKAMGEVGIDLSQKKTQEVFDVWKSGQLFAYVVTVCNEAEAEGCPIFPGPAARLHWPFRDPSKLTGTDEEKLREIREIRNEIRNAIEAWCEKVCPSALAPTVS